jgi:hypothetical protein
MLPSLKALLVCLALLLLNAHAFQRAIITTRRQTLSSSLRDSPEGRITSEPLPRSPLSATATAAAGAARALRVLLAASASVAASVLVAPPHPARAEDSQEAVNN